MCAIFKFVATNFLPNVYPEKLLGQVVQRVNNITCTCISSVNHCPVDTYWQKEQCHPLESDLSGGSLCPQFRMMMFEQQGLYSKTR